MDVLIIESDDGFAEQLRGALESHGIRTAVYADGEQALAHARNQPPRAVVLALELGDRPSAGFSWCNRFKRDELLREVPLVLTSSLATEETFDHHKRLKTRADAYLHKPFTVEQLLAELETWLPIDAPPAGSTEELATELIGDEDLETVDADEIEAMPLEENLDDLFSDLAAEPVAAFPAPEKTVVDHPAAPPPPVEAAAPRPPPPPAEEAALRQPPPPPADAVVSRQPPPIHRPEDFLDVAELRGQVAELQARREADAAELAERDRRLARLREDYAELETRLQAERQRADAAAVQNRKLEATLEVLRRETALLPALEERIATLESRSDDQERELAAARSEADSLRDRLAKAEADLAAAEERLAAESGDHAAQVARMREEWERTAAELEEVSREREQLRGERDQLLAEQERLRSASDAGRAEAAGAQAELTELRGQLEAIRDALAEAERQRDEKAAELDAARARLEAARQFHSRAREMLAELQQQMIDVDET